MKQSDFMKQPLYISFRFFYLLIFLATCFVRKKNTYIFIYYGARARAGGTCLVAVLHAASVIGCWGRAAGAVSVIVCWCASGAASFMVCL